MTSTRPAVRRGHRPDDHAPAPAGRGGAAAVVATVLVVAGLVPAGALPAAAAAPAPAAVEVTAPAAGEVTAPVAGEVTAPAAGEAPVAVAGAGPVVVDVLRSGPDAGVTTVAVADEAAGEHLVDRLEDQPGVLAADLATTYQPAGTLAPAAAPDPLLDQAWHLADVRAPEAWRTTTGAGQVVAVLDSPVDASHPDLAGALLAEVDLVSGEGSSAHGTFVSSLVAARRNDGVGSAGVAPSASVLPVEVCGDAGCSSAAVAEGVRRAVAAGAGVINLSLAGRSRSTVVESAVRSAVSAGVVVVAASGNDGEPCGGSTTACGNPVMYPAALPGVVAVAASDAAGGAAPWAVHGAHVALTAPGERVLGAAPGGGYSWGSGTSFAAPVVAGAAALVRSTAPTLSPAQVRDRLTSTALRRPWPAGYGAGALDAGDAVSPPAGYVADYGRAGAVVRLSGEVLRRYEQTGGPGGPLAWPLKGTTTLRGGAYAAFEGGSVYWSSATGARAVRGTLLQAYGRAGWENGVLGYPTGGQVALGRDGGLLQRFQGGYVYWSRATGAQVVRGAVLERYGSAGWENGVLGYPTTSTTPLRAGGLFAHFQGGSVYWSPATGARVVRGPLYEAWARTGWENGRYGYPTGEQRVSGGRLVQSFQGGTLSVAAP